MLAESQKAPKKIIMCDDHPVCHSAIELTLSQNNLFAFEFARCYCAQEFLDACRSQKFDIGIVDLGLPDQSGLDAAIKIRKLQPKLKLIILTASQSPRELREAKAFGPAAMVHKSSPWDQMTEILKQIDANDDFKFVDPVIESILSSRPAVKLSVRQSEVMKLLTQGLQIKQIAEHLVLSDDTIKEYREIVLRKTNTKNIAELVKWYCENYPLAPQPNMMR